MTMKYIKPILAVVIVLCILIAGVWFFCVKRTRSYELTAIERAGENPEYSILDDYRYIFPWEDLHIVDGRPRALEISGTGNSSGLPGIDCRSRDGAFFTAIVTIEYELTDAEKVFTRFGLGSEKDLRPKIESAIKVEVSAAMRALGQLYPLQHLLSKRHEVRDNALVLLGFEREWQKGPVRVNSTLFESSESPDEGAAWKEIELAAPGDEGFDPQLQKLEDIGISIRSFTIDYHLPPEIEKSLQRRAIAISEISAIVAEEARIAAEENKTKQEIELERLKASSKVNDLVEELTAIKDPELLRALLVKKWDGSLPTAVSNNSAAVWQVIHGKLRSLLDSAKDDSLAPNKMEGAATPPTLPPGN